jgi:hypothetical protein
MGCGAKRFCRNLQINILTLDLGRPRCPLRSLKVGSQYSGDAVGQGSGYLSGLAPHGLKDRENATRFWMRRWQGSALVLRNLHRLRCDDVADKLDQFTQRRTVLKMPLELPQTSCVYSQIRDDAWFKQDRHQRNARRRSFEGEVESQSVLTLNVATFRHGSAGQEEQDYPGLGDMLADFVVPFPTGADAFSVPRPWRVIHPWVEVRFAQSAIHAYDAPPILFGVAQENDWLRV